MAQKVIPNKRIAARGQKKSATYERPARCEVSSEPKNLQRLQCIAGGHAQFEATECCGQEQSIRIVLSSKRNDGMPLDSKRL